MKTVAEKLNIEVKSLSALLILALLGIMVAGYFLYENIKEKESLQGEVADLTKKLTDKEHENQLLSEALTAEQNKIGVLQDQIDDLGDVVGDLDKLAKTDPELLQKYSKVYFLNEHYIPDKLVKIDSEYVADSSKDLYLKSEVNKRLESMLNEAKRDKVDLKVLSAYRSFDTQNSLKSNYSVTYGSGANQFSADQGYSEHQLGTTVDFTSAENNNTLTGFQNTKAYKWLVDNAYKYGFVLSYPENNAYYVFEPWHWRFVGTDLARDLDRDNEFFYDLDQRDIDKYLIEIFD